MPSRLLLQLLLPLTSRTFQTPDGRPRPGPATPRVPLDPCNSQDLTLSSTTFPKPAHSQGFPILGSTPLSPRPRTKHPGDTPLSLFPKSISPQAPVPVPSCVLTALAQTSSAPTQTLIQTLPQLPKLLFILAQPPEGLSIPRADSAPPVVPQLLKTRSRPLGVAFEVQQSLALPTSSASSLKSMLLAP